MVQNMKSRRECMNSQCINIEHAKIDEYKTCTIFMNSEIIVTERHRAEYRPFSQESSAVYHERAGVAVLLGYSKRDQPCGSD